MENMSRQIFVGYQTHSLIEFLLGDETRPGWLEKHSRSQSSSTDGASRNEFASRMAAGSVAA
jgi:hypothetical protein